MTAPRWRNPYKILPALRGAVQGAYVAFFLLAGYEFHLFYTRIVAGTASRSSATNDQSKRGTSTRWSGDFSSFAAA